MRDITSVEATFAGVTLVLQRVPENNVWEASLPDQRVLPGVHLLRVFVKDTEANRAEDEIGVLIGSNRPARKRAERDQDNVLEA